MRFLQLICAAALCLCSLQPATAQGMAARLAALVEEAPLLKNSDVGIAVYDLTAGQDVYRYRSRKLCRPASIQKIITCVSALHHLGAEHTMRTALYCTGTVHDSTLTGDLYVRGGFDVFFGADEMQRLVEAVRGLGIRSVSGNLYADVSMKDSLYFGEGWSWDDARYDFQPMLSPLVYDRGCVEVVCTPSATPGEAARVTCTPASDYYVVRNASVSRRPAAGRLQITRNWVEGTNELIVRGNVAARTTRSLPLAAPEQFFVQLLSERLAQHGIAATPGGTARTPADARLLAETHRPLTTVMREALKESDNLAAEAIFYQLAARLADNRPATANDGVEMIEGTISQLGFDPEAYKIADGSGLSVYDYITPDLMLGFLTFAHSRTDLFEPFYDALPIAGIDGTLAHRMRDTRAFRRVRAKTGTLTGVNSLAGYARAANGHLLAFVIINQHVLKARQARAFQDKVCTILCE